MSIGTKIEQFYILKKNCGKCDRRPINVYCKSENTFTDTLLLIIKQDTHTRLPAGEGGGVTLLLKVKPLWDNSTKF